MDHEASATEHLRSFAQLAELSPDALILVDAAGRILVANGRAELVFGYSGADLRELSVDDLVPLPWRENHGALRDGYQSDQRQRLMGEGKLDLHGLRKDGSQFPAEIALTAVQTEIGVLTAAAIRDISERLRAERQRSELEARLALEQTNAQAIRTESVGALAGGIAHDFNNLLSVVMGNVEFLIAQLAPGTPEHDEALEILHATRRAATLTRQLLLFSRREVVAPEPVDLNDTVADVERLLRRTLGEHVTLDTELTADLPRVMGDPGSLEQILVNLAVNARDAMPGGGRLTIATNSVRIDPEEAERASLEAGEYLRLSVTDTGVGMSSEVAARAFEPFFSTKPKTQGTGLGLATVRAIAQQLRGNVAIASELGQGTTVTVELPLVSSADPATRSADELLTKGAAKPAGDGEHVLLVEDDPAVRGVAEQILRRHGYEVTSLATGAEALDALERAGASFDVLLTDVIMPGLLGPDLAERARALHANLPVVLMSGYVDPQTDLRRFSDADLIQKPFTEASITQALRAALQRPRLGE